HRPVRGVTAAGQSLEQFSLFVSELFAWFFYSSGADKPAYSNRGNDNEKLGKTSEALAVAAPLAVVNGKAFAPARGRWGIRMYAGLVVSAGLALWLLPDTVGAQQQSVDLCKGQVVQSCQADPEVQNQTHEAFKAFAELLAVSQSAAAPGSHWRVRLAS